MRLSSDIALVSLHHIITVNLCVQWCTTLYCDSVGFAEYVPLMYYFVLWFCWICWVCTTDVLLCSVILLYLLSVYHFCATLDLHWTCSSVCHFNTTGVHIQPCSNFGALNLSYTFSTLSYQVLIFTSVKWCISQRSALLKDTTMFQDWEGRKMIFLYYFVLWFCSICSACTTAILLCTVILHYFFSMYHRCTTLCCNFSLFVQYVLLCTKDSAVFVQCVPLMYYFVTWLCCIYRI